MMFGELCWSVIVVHTGASTNNANIYLFIVSNKLTLISPLSYYDIIVCLCDKRYDELIYVEVSLRINGVSV